MNPKIIAFAIEAHHNTCHTYDGKPYSLHLAMVAYYAQKYIHLIPERLHADIIAACWLHDTIEDTRNTYDNIINISNKFIADIVYSVTNKKGRTRSERADDEYYKDIVNTPFASFVKLCDRLANVKYSVETNSRMLNVYRKENENFLKKLIIEPNDKIYADMISELHNLLYE